MNYIELNQEEYQIFISRCLMQQDLVIETDYFNTTTSFLPATNEEDEPIQDTFIGFINQYTI